MAQASASYTRLSAVLDAPEPQETGTLRRHLRGDIDRRQRLARRSATRRSLKDVSFSVKAGTQDRRHRPDGRRQDAAALPAARACSRRPPAPSTYDGEPLDDYDKEGLHQQVGFVFQDSIMFNLTLRENIAFSRTVTDEDLEKAIATAELNDFIARLPQGLDTVVSERGTSLSGGQKQRIMLARALALNPRVLLLDDFTARVDTTTERKILDNVQRTYPGITLLSVTQKIASVEDYDQIVLLMEGEVLATGTHAKLLETSPSTSRFTTRSEAPATMKYTLETHQRRPARKRSLRAGLKRLAPLIAGARGRIAVAFVAMLVSVRRYAGRAGHHRPRGRHLHPPDDFHGVLLSAVVLLAVYLVGLIASYVQTRTMGGVGRRVLFNLRNALFTKLQELPLGFFNQNKAGDLISRINNDTDKLNQFFAQALVQFVGNLFLMTGAAIFLLVAQLPPRARGAAARRRRARGDQGHSARG